MTNHKAGLTKYKEIWRFFRTTWFLPFIWSLTWFSYWLLQDIAVWHKPLNQIDQINIAGTIISIALLLIGPHVGRSIRSPIVKNHVGIGIRSTFVKTRVGRSIRSTIVKTRVGIGIRSTIVKANVGRSIRSTFVKTRVGSSIRSTFIKARIGSSIRSSIVGIHIGEGVQIAPISVGAQTNDVFQMEKSKQELQGVNIRMEKPQQRVEHSQQPFSSVSVCPHNLDYFSLRPRPKQVPEECIGCGNLIQCVCFTNA